MMKMRKALCIILSLIMLFLFASCGGKTENPDDVSLEEETEESSDVETKNTASVKKSFVLPYSESDSLNPYKAKTQTNRIIMPLLYDGLYALDENYTPKEIIAESADIAAGSITVKLKENVYFSDSTPLRASDVVYSFDRAKEAGAYSETLDGISSATALDSFRVKFILSRPDAFVSSVLTFPIIEYGSGDTDFPRGSGRYAFSGGKLVYNKSHISGEKPKIKTVGLYNLNDRASIVDALQIGNVSFAYDDLSDCEVQRAVAQSFSVTLNNLVFIGINSENRALGNKAVRQAINLAVDKESLASHDFHGYAVRTESPFNPKWKESQKKEAVFNQSSAVELLEKNECLYASETDKCRTDKNGNRLNFKIIVSEENEFRLEAAQSIAKYLSQVGISAEVLPLSFGKYKERIKEKNFDLYIGEVKLCENMNLLPFFSKSGKTHYGINLKGDAAKSYGELLNGKTDVTDFEKEFSENLPFIPVCYRCGAVLVTNTLSDNIKSISTDLFYNINEWKMN